MKTVRAVLFCLGSLIYLLAVNQFFFCPRYKFEKPRAFAGSRIYNPYDSLKPEHFHKANFHAHSRCWGGLTNGNGTNKQIHSAYQSLGYSYHAISDYHRVDGGIDENPFYVPAYEHGYNIKKEHQLVIGSSRVHWLDYVFPQAIFNKQLVLNKLNKYDDPILVLAHPSLRNGFSLNDFSRLGGYHYIEILNPSATSIREWDAALSNGFPVFAMGNDDLHDVTRKKELGRFCTWVGTPKPGQLALLKGLRVGQSYSMKIGAPQNESEQDRAERIRHDLPKLEQLTVVDSNVSVSFTKTACKITWIGPGGIRLDSTYDCATSNRVLTRDGSYVRIEAEFPDNTVIYLNPIFRYNENPLVSRVAVIDYPTTLVLQIAGTLLVLLWSFFLIGPILAFLNKLFPPLPPFLPPALQNNFRRKKLVKKKPA